MIYNRGEPKHAYGLIYSEHFFRVIYYDRALCYTGKCTRGYRVSSILQRENWRQLGAAENLYFKPLKGNKALCRSRPSNDKAIAVDMNKQGSGRFLGFNLGKTWNRERLYNSA